MLHADPLASVPVFPEKRRGYDPNAVDDYVQALQVQLADANERAAEAEDRLRTAAMEVQAPESESAATLRAAKQAADETIEEARQQASEVLEEARSRAAGIVEEAQARMEHARAVNLKIEQMKTETANYVSEAERHIQQTRDMAADDIARMKDEAVDAARETRDSAEREAVETRRKADADATRVRNEARDQIAQAKLAIREAEDRVIVDRPEEGS